MEQKFKIKELVRASIDSSKEGVITGVLQRPNDFLYAVSFPGGEERWYYDFELVFEGYYLAQINPNDSVKLPDSGNQ